jgi:hypothetical protein
MTVIKSAGLLANWYPDVRLIARSRQVSLRGIEDVSEFVSDTKQAIWISTTACFEPEGREFESLRARFIFPTRTGAEVVF